MVDIAFVFASRLIELEDGNDDDDDAPYEEDDEEEFIMTPCELDTDASYWYQQFNLTFPVCFVGAGMPLTPNFRAIAPWHKSSASTHSILSVKFRTSQ